MLGKVRFLSFTHGMNAGGRESETQMKHSLHYTATLLAMACLLASGTGCAGKQRQQAETAQDTFIQMVATLKHAFPDHFLDDANIAVSIHVERPTVFGEPYPPEGFAGPDPTGEHPFGIYVPPQGEQYFREDISMRQWILHEMFHLRNRRTKVYVPLIDQAFPDELDPLVQWIMQDPYHRSFAREEAFINLITFADPTRTESQQAAVRAWYDDVGAAGKTLEQVRHILQVIEH